MFKLVCSSSSALLLYKMYINCYNKHRRHMQTCSRPSFRLLGTICFTFHLPRHKSVRAPGRKRAEPLTREGASFAASPSELSYLPFLPCDRDPQLLRGRPHPSLSKHGNRPDRCAVVAAYYLGSLPRPPQRDTICICM